MTRAEAVRRASRAALAGSLHAPASSPASIAALAPSAMPLAGAGAATFATAAQGAARAGVPASGTATCAAGRAAARVSATSFAASSPLPFAARGMFGGASAGAASHAPAVSPWAARAGPSASSPQRRSLFIQTQSTPNPTSLMFLPGKPVLETGNASFANPREAMGSPLAKALFAVEGVDKVFLGSDFVTVTKTDEYEWSVLKPDVFAAITEFFASGLPAVSDAPVDEASAAHVINDDDDEIVAMIKELLETRIHPAVQEDGGDVAFVRWDEPSGVVQLKMMGSCSGCPSSAQTLKGGIENMLKHYIPEVVEVIEAPPDEAQKKGLEAFQKLEQHLSP